MLFSSKQCNKTILDLVFVISNTVNNQGLGECYQRRPLAQLTTLTSTLIILDITETSSNNCLLSLISTDQIYHCCY